MSEYLLYILIFINLISLIYYKRREIRLILKPKKIQEIEVEEVDEIFKPILKKKLKMPKEDAFVKNFCVPQTYNVEGMASDYESWILSVLSKKADKIFEFGTCSGKTTFLFGINSKEDAKIYTITIDPNKIDNVKHQLDDNKTAGRNIRNESVYEEFMFSGHEVEKKIEVIFKDSRDLDIEKLKRQFDLIFIDGGHTYSCVKNDTEKALEMIRDNGIILWHDYASNKRSSKDVYKYLEELSTKIKIENIKNTSLCYYRKN